MIDYITLEAYAIADHKRKYFKFSLMVCFKHMFSAGRSHDDRSIAKEWTMDYEAVSKSLVTAIVYV